MWDIQRTESKGNYVAAVVPDHPHADQRGRVYLHRIVVENHTDRLLSEDEVVHHKDGDPKNNGIENLEVLSQAEHNGKHSTGRNMKRCVCSYCKIKFEKEARNVRGKRVFCSRSHAAKFYAPGRVRGARRKAKPITHGTRTGYRRGCRCDLCRKAQAVAVKKWREGKRGVV
jgi:hypothetical protein